MKANKVLVEMERLRDLNSGLGQFCLWLGKTLEKKNKDFQLSFYVPEKATGILGPDADYIPVSKTDKIFGIASPDFAICHCTHQQSSYLPRDKKTKLVLTIHDLNFLYKYKSGIKKTLKLKALQKKISRADALVFISHFTATVVRKELRIPNIPFRVIYNGCSLGHFDNEAPSGIPEGDYIFSIGIVQPKKNIHVVLPLLGINEKLKFVIAGRQDKDYCNFIREQARKLGVENRVLFLGEVDEKTKYHLYKNCKAFMFPSLSEGFGLPVIEAMSLGKPVFLSNLTSLPETGGPEAFYFDSFAPEAIIDTYTRGMLAYATDQDKKTRIMGWAGKFTWEKAAEGYLKLYGELLS